MDLNKIEEMLLSENVDDFNLALGILEAHWIFDQDELGIYLRGICEPKYSIGKIEGVFQRNKHIVFYEFVEYIEKVKYKPMTFSLIREMMQDEFSKL